MKVILVDDEPLALSHLAEELACFAELEMIGSYRNPRLALADISRLAPDAVFLDIEMPEMSGIALAEKILQQRPHTQIVFVTVYEEYAVKAFDLNAVDYLLKPIQLKRLAQTTERLLQRAGSQLPAAPRQDWVRVQCFRSLQFERATGGSATLRWKTLKAQELFSLLLHLRGKPIRKQTLVDQLWSDIDWKKGITQLYTAIYQIRKLLQDEQLNIRIENVDEGYRLDLNGFPLDIEEWERQMDAAPPLTSESLEQHKQLSAQYKGDYLAEYAYLWAETEKQRLRMKWLSHAKQIANYFIESNNLPAAAEHYLEMQSVLPTEESLYFELMRIYDSLEDRRSVEAQYELLRKMLLQELDMEPHDSIRLWFDRWRSV
ncbi:response regulator [Paenibacillus sp. Leaf72]|uniref:response regulator n=1 Tax=Paenibacillus sp. Leaf72 TaxID=1736234 RepID=UPI0006F65DC0|nr:response regulator [Paenibacillus sp. Leaf72]KQO12445.1 hypothetical protein ASF12_31005 [Paenibacillus sp. Leaf72]